MTRAPRGPAHPEIGIIGLVPERWGNAWMSRHNILTRLAEYYNVVWFSPADGWREWWPVRQPSTHFVPDEPAIPGFSVYRPGRWLPLFHRPAQLGDFTFQMRLRRAANILRARGAKRIVLYFWRPEFSEAIDLLPHDLSLYHIVDDYSFSPTPVPLSEREVNFIKRVDQVIIHSPGLYERKGGFNPHTVVIPNGVNYATFSKPVPEPEDLRAIPHPRIGYTGFVKGQLDLALIHQLALSHPDWSFVFTGAIKKQATDVVAPLRTLRNVFLLGEKTTTELARYPQHTDVNIMPYLINFYTQHIYPLKLHEYLATGKPVVATPIRTLLEFRDVIALADGTEEWSRALRAALQPEALAPELIKQRQAVAQQHDWNAIVARIAQLIQQRLPA